MDNNNDAPTLDRRQFCKSGLGAGAASLAFSSLASRAAAGTGAGYGRGREGDSPDYGPLQPTRDLATGLPLLALPRGFEYLSFGWTGQLMDDGRATPTDHDGMAVCARRGHTIALVRNHELSAGESTQCHVPGGMYNPAEFGGTTSLEFDLARGCFVRSYTSLGGTIRNCAGGPTPWGSWLSCEETFHPWNTRDDGYNHGYIFDVPGFGTSNGGQPVRAAGRFSHEAVAVDPNTGVVYETEDANPCGFYKYVQPGAGHRNWRGGRDRSEALRDGGKLYALVVKAQPSMDLRGGFQPGDTFEVTWEAVPDPEGMQGRPLDSAPSAAIFSRGEGCWEDRGLIYFVSTDGGTAELGQVWVYEPRAETLTMLYESSDASDVDGPDNIAISPRGGIILCEDGSSNPKRMVGLTHEGITFPFAENRIVLGAGDIDRIDAVYPGTRANFWDSTEGDFRGREWAGATFYGDWLFANVQSPGVTFAIRGPWKKGTL
ncbi:alkaline phosphatase PhoX [Microbulbifer sediminum]|uniref:alkaline phosphatase PhoX n=1 Tax=Microbulbifer sediminum TaxID=2904250 RepID=UPI001F3BBC04|nr:alkaline phosphatase PhoX [Microbulbifer sediminum]